MDMVPSLDWVSVMTYDFHAGGTRAGFNSPAQQARRGRAVLRTRLARCVRCWDDVAKVPWLYNAGTKEWISYDDPQSMRLKGEYIASQSLCGPMFWELSNDEGPLLDGLRGGPAAGK